MAWAEAEPIRLEVKETLKARFGIGHVTLELERADLPATNSSRFGHDSSQEA